MKRVLTIHVPDGKEQDAWDLSPAMCEILRTLSVELGNPRIVRRSDGLAVYVHDWKGLV